MHNAPSVNYPVGRSRLAGALLATAWAAGALAVAAWTLQVQTSDTRTLLAWSSVLLSGFLAVRMWARTPAGLLAWDGQTWSWSIGERVLQAHPEVILDLQCALLLRLGEGRSASWLWLEKRWSPARWDDLRRAVYSRARTEGPPGAQPPEATR
jgi:toxin CptA